MTTAREKAVERLAAWLNVTYGAEAGNHLTTAQDLLSGRARHELGFHLVAIDPALIEAVRVAEAFDVEAYVRSCAVGDEAFNRAVGEDHRRLGIVAAKAAAYDAMIAQLRGGR